jgi:hypothetical protein
MTRPAPSDSVHRRVARHACIVLSAILVTCFSLAGLHRQGGGTESRMAALRRAIAAYAQTHGQLPESLQEICRVGTSCPLMPASQARQGMRDEWGRAFVYRQVDGEYELRSLGADGESGTADDLVFRPSWERAWIQAASGCYRTDFARWPEFRGAVLVLDTMSTYPGAFVLKPNPYPYRGLWRVLTQDSVLVEWAEVHSIARIRFRREGDSLVGTAERPSHQSWRAVATRTACPDSSGSR